MAWELDLHISVQPHQTKAGSFVWFVTRRFDASVSGHPVEEVFGSGEAQEQEAAEDAVISQLKYAFRVRQRR